MITIILSIGILLIISLFIFIKTRKDKTEFPTLDPIVENKKYIYNNVYVEQCPPDKLYNDGQVCVSECPTIRPFVIGTSCTSSCTEKNKYLENDKICLPSCFPKYINNNTNKCVEECNKYTDEFLRVCYDSVPDSKFSYENKIVTKCPSYNNSKRECGFPKEVEFLNGIIAGSSGKYISLIGKKNNKYYAYIFDKLEWYDFEIVDAISEPTILSSGDGKVQLIKIPINNVGIKKCIISKDYGKTFESFNVSYFSNNAVSNGSIISTNEFEALDLSADGKNISAIYRIVFTGQIFDVFISNLIILDTFTNNVRFNKRITGNLDKIFISVYSSNIVLLLNNNISDVKYYVLDKSLTDAFDFNADIFYIPRVDGDGPEDKDLRGRIEGSSNPKINPKTYFSLNHELGFNRDINVISPTSINTNNNVNNYNIVKNNDVSFIIDNNKQLYTYDLLTGDYTYKQMYNPKNLNYISNPRVFTGKTNDSTYILDVGNNNKIYKVTLGNEIVINPISNSLNLNYRYISSNLQEEQYLLAIGDNKIYVSNDYGGNWNEMK